MYSRDEVGLGDRPPLVIGDRDQRHLAKANIEGLEVGKVLPTVKSCYRPIGLLAKQISSNAHARGPCRNKRVCCPREHALTQTSLASKNLRRSTFFGRTPGDFAFSASKDGKLSEERQVRWVGEAKSISPIDDRGPDPLRVIYESLYPIRVRSRGRLLGKGHLWPLGRPSFASPLAGCDNAERPWSF
jgi:hypothetical protein